MIRRWWARRRAMRTIDALDRHYRLQPEVIAPDVDPAGWLVLQTDDLTCHVAPLDDLIVHEMPGDGGDKCSCDPAVEPVPVASGEIGAAIVHRALDGRPQYGPVPND